MTKTKFSLVQEAFEQPIIAAWVADEWGLTRDDFTHEAIHAQLQDEAKIILESAGLWDLCIESLDE